MKHRGLTAAVLVSVLLHAVVLGLIVWKKSPPAHETAAVEAVEVELVPEEGEEETQIPNLDLSLDAVTAAEEAALAQKQGSEESADSEEAPTAEDASQSEPAGGEAEAAETEAAEAEAAEAEAETAEANELEAAQELAQEQEQEQAEQQEAETAAVEDDTAGNAPDAEAIGGPPPSPIPLAVGTPTTLYGDAGSGAEGAALPTEAEAADEAAAPPALNEAETGTSDTAGTDQAEDTATPQDAEATAARSEPVPAEDATAEADEPAEDTPVAAISEPEPGEATWGGEADIVSDAMQAPEDAPEEAPAANEAPPTEDPADAPTETAEPEEDTLAGSELAATTPSDQPGFKLPLPKPQREPSEVVGNGAAPASAATSQVSLSDALREALAAGFGGAGEAGRGQVAEVAYTEAVRSAIAPLFFSAMRNVSGSGQVVVAVVIRRDGSVRSAEVVQGSGNTDLDRASLYAAKSAPYPALPPDVTSETLTVHIPLRVR